MREYNDLKLAMKRASAGLVLATSVMVVGCAHQPEHDSTPPVEPAQAQPLPARNAPRVRKAEIAQQIRSDAPLRYVVKKGDTLWDISGYYLRDPWYWPQLWYANPEIENPHLIYPGDVLILTRGADGQLQLRRENTERLSPRVRERSLDSVAVIPMDAIRAFITGPRLVSQDELQSAPYVVSFIDEHMVGGKGTVSYVRHANGEGYNAQTYSLVHDAGPYRDPDSNKILGQEAVPVGEIEITEFGDVSTALITKSYREARVGDRLLPLEDQDLIHDFYPHAPNGALEGRIISVFDGVSAIGQYQVVTLNVGSTDGVERGHVLDIYEAGRTVHDPVEGGQVRLPELKSGQLLVFKTDKQVSFAVIMRARRAVHVKDFVRTPGR